MACGLLFHIVLNYVHLSFLNFDDEYVLSLQKHSGFLKFGWICKISCLICTLFSVTLNRPLRLTALLVAVVRRDVELRCHC